MQTNFPNIDYSLSLTVNNTQLSTPTSYSYSRTLTQPSLQFPVDSDSYGTTLQFTCIPPQKITGNVMLIGPSN